MDEQIQRSPEEEKAIEAARVANLIESIRVTFKEKVEEYREFSFKSRQKRKQLIGLVKNALQHQDSIKYETIIITKVKGKKDVGDKWLVSSKTQDLKFDELGDALNEFATQLS